MVIALLSMIGCASVRRESESPPKDAKIVTTAPAVDIVPAPLGEPSAPPTAAINDTSTDGVSPADASPALSELLRFAQGTLALPKEAQRRVLAQTEDVYAQDRTPANLIRCALLTAALGSERSVAASRIRADLRAYLERSDEGAQDSLLPLASLLLHVLDAREEMAAQLIAQNDLLQRKLDELKAIEQQLLERNEPQRHEGPP
jgi:hypothetical protein